ncbi:radical SAM family heme chaperone HemW [Methylomarinum sp. Ch1-1]|uniref:Heme chaperone HemW n=1 Tax=Methylomarinum roseum TaxID=3067653 RepID=A0AAU7NX73_9GAMM|nr:radical SAM family heme chaperone HemW [Methylomarinum sp. Ch1-1]MDP4522727.1 radical SAM family heme chaperone HemW [Methylomarinum sp. Ch1-1]
MNGTLTPSIPPLSLYIHIPWCIQKCPYCDFNSHAVKEPLQESRYIDALLNDLRGELALLETPRPIDSIFIGGGTPSLFSASSLEYLLNGVQKYATLSDHAEITLEANPGTFESSKFADFHNIGINRLSIGIQSFNDRHLQALGRVHNAAEALRAVEIAFRSGFDNINLDLMFGLPEQRQQEVVEDVETAIGLAPTHISFYQLTLEPNTYFHKFPPPLPADDDIFRAQKVCQQLLAEHGYHQYEVSAYAKQGKKCRHNRNYWRFGDYLGIGAGAHGKISRSLPDNIIRTQKSKRPEHYLKQIDISTRSIITAEQLPLEFVMNHLRLSSGFHLDHYRAVTGLSAETLEPGLSSSVAAGLLLNEDGHYRCSDKGWDFLDSILEKFID